MASPATFDKLPLENALDDSPQIRTLVGLFAADSQALRDYVTSLHQLSSKLVAAHNQLTSAYQDLAKHLKAYKNIKFSVDNDKGEAVAETLEKFASHISEMSSWEHIVATQIADGSVYPLSRFIDTELYEMDNKASQHQTAGLDMEKAISRYSRCRRKDPEMERREANEEVYVTRKKFHQTALNYYAKMNQLQYSHKIALLEPVLGLLVATRAHYNMGHDTLSVPKLEDFLSNVSVSAKSIHDDQMKERNDTLELIDSIITQSQLMYYAQPPADIAALPPDTTLTTKSGYLNVQKKYMGVMSSWERQYVFVEGGNLMGVAKGEPVGSLLLEIDSSTVVHATDTDDRLHVFQVATSKKYVTLQALNDRERDEWMLTIHNLGKDGGYIKDEKVVPPSLLSGVGQFFADKFHAASAAIGSTPPTPTLAGSTATTTSTASTGATSSPPEVVAIPPDAPIVFDLLTSNEETFTLDMNSENDESAGGDVVLKEDEPRTFFGVRFLGSMGVNVDRVVSFINGQSVVCEVMRRILAARAIHNLFSTTELKLCITNTHLVLADPASSAVRLQHSLKEIAYWAAHTENHKLVGYIVRQSDNNGVEGTKYSCFVYEADVSGTDVCSALGVAAKAAYEQLLEKKTFEKKRKQETKLLLANIAQLPDISDPPKVSSDGQFLILDGDLPGESPTHSPPVVPRLPQPAPTPRFPPPAEEEHPESEA